MAATKETILKRPSNKSVSLSRIEALKISIKERQERIDKRQQALDEGFQAIEESDRRLESFQAMQKAQEARLLQLANEYLAGQTTLTQEVFRALAFKSNIDKPDKAETVKLPIRITQTITTEANDSSECDEYTPLLASASTKTKIE